MRPPKNSRTSTWLLASCTSVLLLSCAPLQLFAQTTAACQAPPSVQAELDRISSGQPYKVRLTGLQALLHQYPNDVFLQQAYIRLMDQDKVEGEYLARHEQNPENAPLDFLYGLTLVGRRTPDAIKLFDAALKKDPTFTLPHLELVTIYTSPVFQNKEKSVTHLKAFLEACPDSLAGYKRLADVRDKDLQSAYTGKFRGLLERRTDKDAVSAYQPLWSLEFKTRSAAAYPALREQVSKDLARIRTLKLEDHRQWYETLETGYRLVNDPKQVQWAEEQFQSRFPSADGTPEMAKWFKDHPRPDSSASPPSFEPITVSCWPGLTSGPPSAPKEPCATSERGIHTWRSRSTVSKLWSI